jgi:hypothetical protein
LNAIREGADQTGGDHKLKVGGLHFGELVLRQAFLKGEKVFGGHAIRLVQHLPPAIPRSRFRGKHPQAIRRKILVGIGLRRRKKEIGLLVAFRRSPVAELMIFDQTFFEKDFARL